MAKLRNVQFYRNEGNLTSYSTHSDAMSAAQTTFGQQLANMQDGEMLLYRYTITGDDTVHTITGVVRKNGSANYVEILANADMLFSGNAADVTYVNSTSGLMATNVQDAIDEVEGRVDTLEQGVQSLNAVMGVIVDSTELTKDGNGKVTIDTDDDHAYDGSNNPLATVETVTSAVSALNTVIGNEFTALNGTAGIASASNGVVTLKAGVIQTDGKIANSSDSDITLAKVATTGEAEDVLKTSNSAAAYNTTAGEISSDWVSVVNGNALANGDTVDADLNKLDTKIAGLADEFIDKEQVTVATFNAVKGSVGLENNFSLDLTGDETGIIENDTNVKAALIHLADAIDNGESKVKDVAINGASVVAENGVAGIIVEGTYNADTNKIATQSTVSTAVINLNSTAGIASVDNQGVVTIRTTVNEVSGLIQDGEQTITLAKVAYNAVAGNLTYTYVNGVEGTMQAAGNNYENRIAALEALPTFDTVVSTEAGNTPQGVKWGDPEVTGTLVADATTMHKIYLVPNAGSNPNSYAEYITVKNGSAYTWEKIGDTATDLTGYVKTIEMNGKTFSVDTDTTNVDLGNVVTDVDKAATNVTANTVNGYITLDVTEVVNATDGTKVETVSATGHVQAVSTADASHMGLAEASDVKDYVDTTISNLGGGETDTDAFTTVTVNTVAGEVANVDVTTEVASTTYTAQSGDTPADLTVDTTTGALTGDAISDIKSYVDAKAGAATLTEGDGIDITSNVVSVDLATNAVYANGVAGSATNMLKFDTTTNQLSIIDTWDCGTY